MTEEKKQEEAKQKAAPKEQAADKKEEKKVSEQAEGTPPSDKGGEDKPKVELSQKMQDIISSIEGMTVLELSNLVKALEDKFGVTAAQPMIAAAGMGGAAAPKVM